MIFRNIALPLILTIVGILLVIKFDNYFNAEPSIYSYVTIVLAATLNIFMRGRSKRENEYNSILSIGLISSGLLLAGLYINSINLIKLVVVLFAATFIASYLKELFYLATKEN